jgi:hypothetical protein
MSRPTAVDPVKLTWMDKNAAAFVASNTYQIS